jgi:3-methylfumaryl-CoA hydratase
MPGGADLSHWVGRSETRREIIAAAPLRGLAALLDYESAPWADGCVPPLAHWLYFLPGERQSELGADGHPKRGGFLPPVELPRRMWAGGRLKFHADLRVGALVERTSRIKDVAVKTGASGEMVFVTVSHAIHADGVCAIEEEQDIVYRGAGASAAHEAPEARQALHERPFRADPVALFRFSALTFNAHRIHYDRDYAVREEGYPGLVVQGPYVAMLLMDHHRRAAPGARVREFAFRARRPLIEGEDAVLCALPGGELWCRNAAGATTMSARVVTE